MTWTIVGVIGAFMTVQTTLLICVNTITSRRIDDLGHRIDDLRTELTKRIERLEQHLFPKSRH